ncbi:ribosome maturation factor RimM [Desulfothermobacter acidiphilus]|uniref:ribosome maturation factor RimM n=1 Tax=Desulfothermobacter acidiphilus TaxID=1938353 RepID=UPI003F8B75DC
MRPDFVTVGEIVAPHGCKGGVKVRPLTDFPERFRETRRILIYLKGQRLPYTIVKVQPQGRFVLLELAEVQSMDEAEELRGGLLQVPREEVYPLPPGHFYIFELIDMEVYTEEGDFLGKVEEVLSTRAHDIFAVRSPAGRELLIPALKTVVLHIDTVAGRMKVRLPAGLL